MIDANSFNVIAGTYFANESVGIINVDNFNVTTGTYLSNNSDAEISAVSFNVTTERDFVNDSAIIGVDNFNVTSGNIFRNRSLAVINADSFNVTAVVDFLNDNFARINAVSFNATTERDFVNDTATINVDNFNVTAGVDFLNDTFATINADNFNVTAGDDFLNDNSSTIDADNVTIEVTNFADDITNASTVSSDSLNFILTDDFTHNSTTLNDFNNFSNLGVSTDGSFTNNSTIDLAGNLGITANDFINTSGTISADTLTISVAGDFDYSSDFLNNGTNTVDNLNFTARNGAFTNDTTIDLAGNLTITANTFTNTGGVVSADTLALSVAGDFDYLADYLGNGSITTNALNLNVDGDFSNNDSSSDFTWGANDSLVVSGNADITATDFTNAGTISVNAILNITATSTVDNSFENTGEVAADIFNLFVAGDFDYIADYLNNGTITNNAFNLIVGGNFIYDDSASDFTWDAQNSLIVLGNADITTDNYTQNGAIDVTGALTINVESDFDYVGDFNGTIDFNSLNLNVGGNFIYNDLSDDFTWGDNDSLVVSGNAGITTNNFNNGGNINVTGSGSLAITAGYTAINQGSIVSANLDVIANDFFRNLTGGDINVANLNIIAGGKVTNTANINVGTLTITANNDSTRTNDTTGFYVSNRGNITATSLNIAIRLFCASQVKSLAESS